MRGVRGRGVMLDRSHVLLLPDNTLLFTPALQLHFSCENSQKLRASISSIHIFMPAVLGS